MMPCGKSYNIFIETTNKSLQDYSTTSESTYNTKSNGCLMNGFELMSSAFDLDAPLLCSTPLSRKDHDREELRIVNKSVEDYGILSNLDHQKTMTYWKAYLSHIQIMKILYLN